MIHQGSEQAMDTEETAASRTTLGRELGAEVFPPAGQAPLGFVYVPESAFSPCQLCPLAGAVRMGPAFPLASALQNGHRLLRGPIGARERETRPTSQPDGTVTILFTDIEGFAPLTERLGDRRAQEVMRGHHAIVRALVATHGGLGAK